MSNPYREMIAELSDRLQRAITSSKCDDFYHEDRDSIDRANALLDQPVTEGLTLDEVGELCEEHGFLVDGGSSEQILQGLINDALARCSRPTPQPLVDCEATELAGCLRVYAKLERTAWRMGTARTMTRAADLLERLASDNVGLEAAAESAYLDNLSLLPFIQHE